MKKKFFARGLRQGNYPLKLLKGASTLANTQNLFAPFFPRMPRIKSPRVPLNPPAAPFYPHPTHQHSDFARVPVIRRPPLQRFVPGRQAHLPAIHGLLPCAGSATETPSQTDARLAPPRANASPFGQVWPSKLKNLGPAEAHIEHRSAGRSSASATPTAFINRQPIARLDLGHASGVSPCQMQL